MKATTKKTAVKKATDKNIKKPVAKKVAPVKVVKEETKIEKPSYTYKNIQNTTLKDAKKIKAFLKKEEKRLLDRMIERKIKEENIQKLTKYIQHQFLGSKNTFISVKYIFLLQDGTKKLIHFGKRIK